MLHVVPAQSQRLTVTSDAADHDVNMRVLRVVVLHRNPFQIRSQILLHLFDQTARQARQFYPITEFRRDDQFKHPLVPRALPAFELTGNVDSVILSIETHGLHVVFEGGPFARQVTPVRLPLLGIKRMRVNAQLNGPHAQLRIKERQPQFYFYLPEVASIGDYLLLRLAQRPDVRQIEIGEKTIWKEQVGVDHAKEVSFTY